jgi:hypothetical protein
MNTTPQKTSANELEKKFACSYRWAVRNVVQPIADGAYKKNPNSAANFRAKMEKWKEESENAE